MLPFAARCPRRRGRIAILGNAAGTTARAYGHYFPRTRVDAVEIDGELTRDRTPLVRHARAAPATLHRRRAPVAGAQPERYDAIFVDAYRQPYIPFYLTTREFFSLVRDAAARRAAW